MLLQKRLPLTDVALKMDGDTGKFAGYASVFGGVDSYGDTILQGAFETTLKRDGKPKMFLQHQVWDGLPIGKWIVAKEDDHGLYVEGELTPGMSQSTDVYAAMQHGTLDGLSVGGYLKDGDFDSVDGKRIIRKWSRLVEISVVVFPADSSARIDVSSVKHALEGVETIRDFERLLRDVGGFSKEAAQTLVSRAKDLFALRDVGGEDAAKQANELALLTIQSSMVLARKLP